MSGVLIRRKRGRFETHRPKKRLEWCFHKAKEDWKPPQARRVKERFSLESSEGERACLQTLANSADFGAGF